MLSQVKITKKFQNYCNYGFCLLFFSYNRIAKIYSKTDVIKKIKCEEIHVNNTLELIWETSQTGQKYKGKVSTMF